MRAILELKETPQSCGECQLRGYNEALDYDDHEGYAGAICHGEKSLYMEVSDYLNTTTRHPDCPLKIIEGIDADVCKNCIDETECLIKKKWLECKYFISQNNRRWIKTGGYKDKDAYINVSYECPKCNSWKFHATNFCPNCGIKLLPPEDKEESC